MAFPFLQLPMEIRLKIYSYLLIPEDQEPFCGPPAPTYMCYDHPSLSNMLYVNRQIYAEASPIFYGRSEVCIVAYTIFITCHTAFPESRDNSRWALNLFRVDKYCGRRTLRSGRAVDTSIFSGSIYPHVFNKLSVIEMTFGWSDQWSSCLREIGLNLLINVLTVLCEQSKGILCSPPAKSLLQLRWCKFWGRPQINMYGSSEPQDEQPLFAMLVREGVIDLLKEVHKTRTVIIYGVSEASTQRLIEALDKH
ncbi:hypothetical protein MMC24_000223 [Lignoscripta atroalba]|nr:hypothetical protein [Lignoscripta atroalba]